MVKLITHNLLCCHARGCNYPENFPLVFRDVTQLEVREADYNAEFLQKMMPRLEWKALVDTAKQLGDTSLPEELPEGEAMDEEFLKKLHHVLMEIHIEEGAMHCPKCDHKYPILQGIPNMLLAEHEIGR
ncbi:Trm112p-domain-containing protein [Calocera viscosa TUFC12733]|uniref:Trm112p-domain-containing protein n=1 Tax=Calocera viscosa (strain TUFC12733) TaxID=1330018 RepID=A0A167LF90_CALVF|nr:Trm112p-domain-containing protein [Calocera viscosa TUFC12733]